MMEKWLRRIGQNESTQYPSVTVLKPGFCITIRLTLSRAGIYSSWFERVENCFAYGRRLIRGGSGEWKITHSIYVLPTCQVHGHRLMPKLHLGPT